MNALMVKDVVKTYKNGTQALKGISLEIKEGDFYALLGANGAGKTTLIGIITSLVNKSSGQIQVFGDDIDKNFSQAKKNVGIVPQEFNFNIFEKVFDIVVQQAGFYGIPKEKAEARANELLDKLGLGEKKNVISQSLSGGMKRRLMIARALVHSPKLLILDEPTAGVDVELRHGMWEYLSKLNQEGLTILLTTHYLEEVEQLCKNASIIKNGKIVKEGSVKSLLNSLGKETFVLEIESKDTKKDSLSKFEKQENPFEVKIIDKDTLEIRVDNKKTNFNQVINQIDIAKIKIKSIRPKGNRLEELFLEIVGDKSSD